MPRKPSKSPAGKGPRTPARKPTRVAAKRPTEAVRAASKATSKATSDLSQERIVRALEVIELTGAPFSATLPSGRFALPAALVALRVPRAQLDARIGARTAAMWEAGLPAEVEALAARGLADTRTASRAVGYAQCLDQLAGRLTAAQAIEATATATRRLVRRQESWLRGDPRVTWLDAPDGTDVGALADRALDVLRAAEADQRQ